MIVELIGRIHDHLAIANDVYYKLFSMLLEEARIALDHHT